jgi:hypothetical protein
MNKLILISFFAFAIFLSSCGKCGGVDTIHSIDGLILETPKDSVVYYASTPSDSFTLHFFLNDHSSSRKGTRDCHQKDLAISFENEWKKNGFEFQCLQTLVSGNDTIKPFTNLLGTPICRHFIPIDATGRLENNGLTHLRLTGFNKPALKQNHTFLIKGTTTDNKTFTDSCHIYIH